MGQHGKREDGNMHAVQSEQTLTSLNSNTNLLHAFLETAPPSAAEPASYYLGADDHTNNATDETRPAMSAESSSSSVSTLATDKVIDSEKHDITKVVTNSDVEQEFPEGGLRAWTVVFGCFCGLVACFGLVNTVGVIETHIQENQLASESSSTIGWIFSLMLFICFGSCIFSGTYFDRNGFRDPMIFGSICHVAGLFGMANSTKIWHFILSFSVLCGFGNGIVMSPLVSAPSHYFFKKRGTATALSTVGGSIGGVVFPIMLRQFFKMKSPANSNDPNYGFVWGIRTLAFIDLFLFTMAIFLATERSGKGKAIVPVARGSEPHWKYILNVYILQSFDARGFLDMKYLFCVMGTVFGEMSLTAVVTYYGSYSTYQGISASDAYMLITIINICGIPGRWIPGYLSDIFGRFNVAIATLSSLGILMLVGWLPFGKNLTSMYVISGFYGFFSGSIFSLLPVCCGQISKTEEFGKRYATMYCVVAFSTLISVPITGAIIGDINNHPNYSGYIIFCSVLTTASAVSFVISRYFCVGSKWKRF